MTWLDALDTEITEALKRFPSGQPVASADIAGETYLVSRQSLEEMQRMQLGHLPTGCIALPDTMADMLTRPHQETLVRDVTHHLSDYFPNFFVAAIYELQSLFGMAGYKAYIIGGITRGMLLSPERRYQVEDVDITIEGQAIEAAETVCSRSNNFRLIQTFPSFGTAKVDYKEQIHIDFASTREEVYTASGALPEIVTLGAPLEVDITRRDFTVNALALSIRQPGQVIDCTGGLQDLETRQIRLLKPVSFFEDPTRILRGLMFAARLDFKWAEDTVYVLDQFLPWMPSVYKGGGERVREELFKLLRQPETPYKIHSLRFLMEKGLHRLIDTRLPELSSPPLSPQAISMRLSQMQARLSEWWSPSLHGDLWLTCLLLGLPAVQAEAALIRLGVVRTEIELYQKSRMLMENNVIARLSPTDSAVDLYETFSSYPFGASCVGVLLSQNFETSLEVLQRYKSELEPVRLEITGDDIVKLGVPPSERVGQLLREVKHARLQHLVTNRLEELTWLKARLAVDRPAGTERQPG